MGTKKIKPKYSCLHCGKPINRMTTGETWYHRDTLAYKCHKSIGVYAFPAELNKSEDIPW